MQYILEFEDFLNEDELELTYIGINDIDDTFEVRIKGKLFSYKQKKGGPSLAVIDRKFLKDYKYNKGRALAYLKKNTDLVN